MTRYVCLVLFACLILVGSAQPHCAQSENKLTVVKYEWSKERINWTGDPLSTPNETYNDMRDRVRTERRTRSALEERLNRDAKEEQKRPSKPPRYVFRYLLTVQNNSMSGIKEIDWDYLFSDAATGELLGQREFTSVEKIGPGKKKQLSVLVSAPPTKTVSVYVLGSDERAGLVERVVIHRVLYEDGNIWSPESSREPQ